jgi:hypothetical protein
VKESHICDWVCRVKEVKEFEISLLCQLVRYLFEVEEQNLADILRGQTRRDGNKAEIDSSSVPTPSVSSEPR